MNVPSVIFKTMCCFTLLCLRVSNQFCLDFFNNDRHYANSTIQMSTNISVGLKIEPCVTLAMGRDKRGNKVLPATAVAH